MRDSPWYIAALVAFIGASFGYLYITADILDVRVAAKHVGESRARLGFRSYDYVLETDHGPLELSSLPVMGYGFGKEQAFGQFGTGITYKVRVITWPLGNKKRREIIGVIN